MTRVAPTARGRKPRATATRERSARANARAPSPEHQVSVRTPAAVVPLSELAYRELMKMILAGGLAPNDLITERQIALQLGISRTPVREAVRRLEGARLLERQKSGALVVRALPVDEYMQILAVRKLLEGEAARLAAGRVAGPELQRLTKRIEDALALPDEQPLPEAASGEGELHRLVAAAAGNPVLEELIGSLRTRVAMFRFGRLPARRRQVLVEHLDIVEALRAGDGERARKAMETHIENVRATILARLSGH